jgi:hypothetical protein
VHVGDAVYQRWEYGTSSEGPGLLGTALVWRREEFRRTLESLRACEADPRRPTIVPSHDHEIYASLPHAPTAV